MAPLLNVRWENFCIAYFLGKSDKAAAIEAGYLPNLARHIGSKLLKKREIRARIKELQESATTVATMSVRERKESLSKIARANPENFVAQIRAIAELNKMEKFGATIKSDETSREDDVTGIVFVMPDGSRRTPRELVGGNNDKGNQSPPGTG